MGLNIASAFRLRNKLKERIKTLSEIAKETDVSKRVGTAENTVAFDGKTFQEVVTEMNSLMATLRDLNLAINKANEANREDLIHLETLKAEIAFYESTTRQIRKASRFSYDYDERGNRVKIENELLLDQKTVVSYYKGLKKKKDDIEEKLAHSNAKTQVDFDRSIIEKLL